MGEPLLLRAEATNRRSDPPVARDSCVGARASGETTRARGPLRASGIGSHTVSLDLTLPPVAAPPRPRITLRVGATGHRAKALESVDKTALRDSVRLALRKIAEHAREVAGVGEGDYSADPPRLVLVSALAEGADQLIADVGLELGYELDAPLPFVRDEYKKDFADTSGFDRLIRRARSVLELDGDRSTGPLPYARVGRILLGHTDVLLAIWDGEAANGRGGTGEVVVGAVALGIPVIWISSKSPNTCSVISAGAEAWEPRSHSTSCRERSNGCWTCRTIRRA